MPSKPRIIKKTAERHPLLFMTQSDFERLATPTPQKLLTITPHSEPARRYGLNEKAAVIAFRERQSGNERRIKQIGRKIVDLYTGKVHLVLPKKVFNQMKKKPKLLSVAQRQSIGLSRIGKGFVVFEEPRKTIRREENRKPKRIN